MSGRKKSIDHETRDQSIWQLFGEGMKVRAIAARLSLPMDTIYARLPMLKARYGAPQQSAPPKASRPGIDPERLAYGHEPLPANCALARRIFAGASA